MKYRLFKAKKSYKLRRLITFNSLNKNNNMQYNIRDNV